MSDRSPAPRRSRLTLEGLERTSHRTFMRALGLDEAAMAKPFVGVMSTHGENTPCSMSLRPQADAARMGVAAAGGTPREFTTISVADGVSMNHRGMRMSLVSREIIADSIEAVVRGHAYDALVGFAGCDKTLPGIMMAMVRLNCPSVFVYGGRHVLPRPVARAARSAVHRLRGRGLGADGGDDRSRSCVDRARMRPDPRLLPGQFTANTMAMVSETLGLALPGSAMLPAVYSERLALARRAGETVMRILADGGPLPRDLVTRKSLENACAAVAATGGSTNAGLHLPAIAHEAGIAFDLDDVAEVFERTPLIANLQPGGKYLARDLHYAGGVTAVLKALLDGGHLHGDADRCPRENAGGRARTAPPGPMAASCTRANGAMHPSGGVVVLKGNLCPDGALIKIAGLKSLVFEGRARVFECEEDAARAVKERRYKAGDVMVIRNEGPKGGPGMREMLGVTALIYGQQMGERVALLTDGRFPARRAACASATPRPRPPRAARSRW